MLFDQFFYLYLTQDLKKFNQNANFQISQKLQNSRTYFPNKKPCLKKVLIIEANAVPEFEKLII